MPDALWHFSGQAIAILAGAFTLWALFADRAKGRRRCRKCWYDLASLGEVPVTCPECGKAHNKPKHLKRTRRHKRLAVLGLLVMLVGGYGLWVVPRVKSEGRHGFVPDFLLGYYVPHLRLPETHKYPRLQAKNRELFREWETPEGIKKLRRHMRIWLLLGLVDPSGLYGDPKLKTSADLSANVGNWTGAGGAFQAILPMEDLPQWARWTAMRTQISGIFLWVEPKEEGGDLSQAVVRGNRRWDVQIGDMVITIRSRDDSNVSGMTMIGKLAEIPTRANEMLALSVPELEQLGWQVPGTDAGSEFVPPPFAVLKASPIGIYPARVRLTENGELVGEYDIDFELEPPDWQNPQLRILKATQTVQLTD